MSRRKKQTKQAKTAKKPALLVLLPFLPSETADRQEAQLARFLERLTRHYEVRCVPEGLPTAARATEQSLVAKGMTVYALGKPPKRAELDAGIRDIITENHAAKTVLICGLDLISRHLFQLRLFAQDRKFGALLLPDDARKLEFGECKVSERIIRKADAVKTFSHAHVLCTCSDLAVDELQKAADMPVLGAQTAVPALAKLSVPDKPQQLGVILLPQAAKMQKLTANMLLRHACASPKFFQARDCAGISALVSRNRAVQRWLVVAAPFMCAPELPAKLLFMADLFGDAGIVMPSVLKQVEKNANTGARLIAEAFALSKRGLFREPFYIHNPTLLCINSRAWLKTGGADPRLASLDYSLTDVGMRMYQAGHRTVVAEDLAIFNMGQDSGADRRQRQHEREVLTRKWCLESLKFMELLLSEIHSNS